MIKAVYIQPFIEKNSIMIKRFLIYSMLGIYLEILWTGIRSGLILKLMGHSSVIMMFIYGSVVLMEPAFRQLKDVYLPFRGMIYALFIFAAEYFSGLALMHFGICPWDYSHAFYNMKGVIRLDYMPLWFFVGLIYERLYFGLTPNNNK